MKEFNLEDILSDTEKLALEHFIKNEVQREAVKKVLLSKCYYDGVLQKGVAANPYRNFALALAQQFGKGVSNEELGEKLRASYEGISLVELGFDEIEKLTKTKKERSHEDKNPAR